MGVIGFLQVVCRSATLRQSCYRGTASQCYAARFVTLMGVLLASSGVQPCTEHYSGSDRVRLDTFVAPSSCIPSEAVGLELYRQQVTFFVRFTVGRVPWIPDWGMGPTLASLDGVPPLPQELEAISVWLTRLQC